MLLYDHWKCIHKLNLPLNRFKCVNLKIKNITAKCHIEYSTVTQCKTYIHKHIKRNVNKIQWLFIILNWIELKWTENIFIHNNWVTGWVTICEVMTSDWNKWRKLSLPMYKVSLRNDIGFTFIDYFRRHGKHFLFIEIFFQISMKQFFFLQPISDSKCKLFDIGFFPNTTTVVQKRRMTSSFCYQ